jgi:hypothetical protein
MKEMTMNMLFRTCAGVAVATLPVWACATDPTASPPAIKGDSYSTMAKTTGDKKADAKAEENRRLGACKSMNGDEKKTCEANAKAKMASEMNEGKAHEGAMVAGTTPKK